MNRAVLFAVTALLAAAPLRAQVDLGLAGGLTVPVSELGRIDKVGYHLSGVLQSVPPLAGIGLRGDVSFNALGREETIQNVTERIISVTAGPMLHPIGTATSYPYAVGAFGLYNMSTSPAPSGSRSSTDLGVNLGAGVRFAVGARRAFAEIRYHRILAKGGARYVPATFGLLF